jgi:hypothetical protein
LEDIRLDFITELKIIGSIHPTSLKPESSLYPPYPSDFRRTIAVDLPGKPSCTVG